VSFREEVIYGGATGKDRIESDCTQCCGRPGEFRKLKRGRKRETSK